MDAVLSEDVDAIMFGSRLTLRNWSSEGTRGNKTPTHVSMYDADTIRDGESRLTAKGILLVALMSGGDYNPAGIPGCGVKLACEAARAGFGESLCALSVSDAAGIRSWRDKLSHELRTNESKFFKTKHKSLKVPDEFPNKIILDFYLNPAVSSLKTVEQLSTSLDWNGKVDLPLLRQFVGRTFDWQYLSGAKKLIRVITLPLLVRSLLFRAQELQSGDEPDSGAIERHDSADIKEICGRRSAFSGDGLPEVRVSYVPLDIVRLDLNAEEPADVRNREHRREQLQQNDHAERSSIDSAAEEETVAEKQERPVYDPSQLQKSWIWERLVEFGAPMQVLAWNESQRKAKEAAETKALERARKVREAAEKRTVQRARKARGGMEYGAIHAFVRVTKQLPKSDRAGEKKHVSRTDQDMRKAHSPGILSTASHDLIQKNTLNPTEAESAEERSSSKERTDCKASKNDHYKLSSNQGDAKRVNVPVQEQPEAESISPWSLSQMSPDNLNFRFPPEICDSAFGIYETLDSTGDKDPPSEELPESIEENWEAELGYPFGTSSAKERILSRKHSSTQVEDAVSSATTLHTGLSCPKNCYSPEGPPSSLKHPLGRVHEDLPPSNSSDESFSSCTLPPSSALLSNPAVLGDSIPSVISIPSSPIEPPLQSPLIKRRHDLDATTRVNKGNTIALRDSLDGAWKEVNEETAIGPRGRIWKNVEVLDLT